MDTVTVLLNIVTVTVTDSGKAVTTLVVVVIASAWRDAVRVDSLYNTISYFLGLLKTP